MNKQAETFVKLMSIFFPLWTGPDVRYVTSLLLLGYMMWVKLSELCGMVWLTDYLLMG